MLSYLIQSLSAERAFGLKLSSPVKAQIPQKYATMGTAGDFMIHVRHPLLSNYAPIADVLHRRYILW